MQRQPLPGALTTSIASLAKAARRLKPRHQRHGLPLVLLLTDPARLDDPAAVIAALPRGFGVVLRHYDAAADDRRSLARALAAACRRRRLLFLVAGDSRLAAAVGAGGCHWPEYAVRLGPFPGRHSHPHRIDTAAAHSAAAIRRAAVAGMDAVLVSPVFATGSHPGAKPLGPLAFARLVRQSPLPVFALGGITTRTAGRLNGSGAAGFACVGAFAPPPSTPADSQSGG